MNSLHCSRPFVFALFLASTLVLSTRSGSAQSRSSAQMAEILSNHESRLARLESEVDSIRGKSTSSGEHRYIHSDPSPAPSQHATIAHRVKTGESLAQIARRNHSTVGELARINNIENPDRLRVGQMIQIPNPDFSAGSTPSNPSHVGHPSGHHGTGHRAEAEHVVQSGDTLFRIASSHGVSINDLRASNGLSNDHIFIGQRIKIPGTGSAAPVQEQETNPDSYLVHRVERNETSASIARKFGITVDELAQANGLRDAGHIYVGQSLQIPTSANPASHPLDLGLSGSTQTVSGTDTQNFATYRVRKGDTVTAIAREFQVSPHSIRDANDLGPDAGIRSGQDIRIPVDQFWATLAPPQ